MDVQRTITQVYNLFEYSAVRYERVRELQAALKVQVKKFKKPSNVRWLSVESAVEAIHDSWAVLVASLENEWETNRTPEAKGLAQKINSYALLAKTCIMLLVTW